MEEKEKQMDELAEAAENRDLQKNEQRMEPVEARDRDRSQQRLEAERSQQPSSPMEEALEPLFDEDRAERFRSHWLDIQARFVDDPREAVKKADELVEDVIKTIAEGFSQRRTSLEDQWNSGDNVSTEDLRLAIKRYRSFFDRLLKLES